MRKQTKYGKEARTIILEGVKEIVDAIKVTLGPKGRNVVICKSDVIDYGVKYRPLHVTKDGWTVSRDFECDDPFKQVGVLMIKEVCTNTVIAAGDGTSTSAVLAGAILEIGMRLVDEGANPIELKQGIDAAVEQMVSAFKEMAIQVGNDNEKVFEIATISANNDPVIGRIIADAFKKIGNEGVIDIDESKGLNTEIIVADGFKFDRGWVSPHFITNKPKEICEFENALILLYDKRVTHHTQVEKALEIAIGERKPLLIICEDAEGEGLAILAMNNIQQRIAVCVVKSPEFGNIRTEYMEDISTLTGGTYISDIRGIDVKEIEIDQLGFASKITVTKDETVIIGGAGNKESIEALVNDLRMNLAHAKTEEERYPIEKRIARLTGGVAVIKVGAATETELKEKLDRYDDAVRATKAAISEGYVGGGGIAFLNARLAVDLENPLYKGMGIIAEIKEVVIKQICENAGLKYELIKEQIKAKREETGNNNLGYNAKTDTVEDLVKAGVIEPVKVLRCALQNAASAAGMILTSEAMIVDTL